MGHISIGSHFHMTPASQGHEAGRACVGYDRDMSAVFDRVPLPLSGLRFAETCRKSAMFVVYLQEPHICCKGK